MGIGQRVTLSRRIPVPALVDPDVVKSAIAVAYHWGVDPKAVRSWQRALEGPEDDAWKHGSAHRLG